MQTACWQFCFSDRFTGARNPARLPTTIQSRRIRYAPTWLRWQVLQPHCTPPCTPTWSGDVYNRSMPDRGNLLRPLVVSLLLLGVLCAGALAAPMTKINIVVKNQGGKPVDRASVVVRFIQGHSIIKLGKAVRTTFELRTNQDGEARIPSIPQGKILVQI